MNRTQKKLDRRLCIYVMGISDTKNHNCSFLPMSSDFLYRPYFVLHPFTYKCTNIKLKISIMTLMIKYVKGLRYRGHRVV